MTLASRPIALTIGVFDGLHRGHQAIVGATVAAARGFGGAAWVATFDPHPDAVVRGSAPRPWITPPEERAALLHALGVDRVEVVRFDREVQALTPEGFLDRVLGPEAPLRALVVGPDFRMGKDRVGDRAYLEALGARRGFAVREVPFLVGPPGSAGTSGAGAAGPKLSSTLLRKAIEEGRVQDAAEIMGRSYSLEGMVGSGAGRGTELGYPTANLELGPQKLLPAPGIYVSLNKLSSTSHPGITYVGSAGTFGPGPVRVEVHLFDFAGSLRGKSLKTLLIERLRADKVFESSEDLVRAMDADLALAKARWAEIRSGGAIGTA